MTLTQIQKKAIRKLAVDAKTSDALILQGIVDMWLNDRKKQAAANELANAVLAAAKAYEGRVGIDRKNSMTEEMKKNAVQLRKSGFSHNEIAARLKVTKSTITRLMNKEGL